MDSRVYLPLLLRLAISLGLFFAANGWNRINFFNIGPYKNRIDQESWFYTSINLKYPFLSMKKKE
jgi:hypothetical protein